MPRFIRLLILLPTWFFYVVSKSAAAEEQPINYARDIQPILARKCYACHGPGQAEAGLRLHETQPATSKLESGATAIVPGKPEHSELLKRVTTSDADLRMPPEGKPLSEKEVALLTSWIKSGATFDAHWTFQKLTRPAVPAVKNTAWVRNEIDNFVLHKLETAQLTPVAPAAKATWLRRATQDLLGLPPTAQELTDYLADQSPQADEKVIDRLLASPHYGERWARHWLDLVRYAETNSFERDGLKPNAWRYRDYVIRSFNEDKPYNQFIREQLAGDEKAEPTADEIIATGYYRLGVWDDEPADRLQAKFDELDDIVSNVGQVFMGLTINCARCHDHKIDPITQRDYYAMLAVFHEVNSYGGNSQRIIPDTNNQQLQLTWEQEVRDAKDKILDLQHIAAQKLPENERDDFHGLITKKVLRDKLLSLLDGPDRERYQKLSESLKELERRGPNVPRALAVICAEQPPKTFILARGNPNSPTTECQPSAPTLFGKHDFIPAKDQKPKQSSGRRTALANWLADDENWMTARVMANRLWQHHFGRGIVRSPNNFGMLGVPPTHPELLNYLATELIQGGWKLKSLHKKIMLSQTYHLSIESNPTATAKDPNNDLFWRFDLRRMSAEELRDSIHFVTGEFNPQLYGPSIYATISKEVLAGQSRPGSGWGNSSPKDQARRSIYIHVKRSLVTPLLSTFDFPETDTTCEARFNTTQPGQALSLINGDFIQERAKVLAARVKLDAGDQPEKQIASAIQLVLNRTASASEIERGQEFLQKLQTEHKTSADEALRFFCLSLFNRNEFLFIE